MGLYLSTNKYSLEYSYLPDNYKKFCISLYNYDFLMNDKPTWFIYKENHSLHPKWLYYHGYINNVLDKGLLTMCLSDRKLENKSIKFDSLLSLTNFLKDKSKLNNINKLKFYNINNNYLEQLV